MAASEAATVLLASAAPVGTLTAHDHRPGGLPAEFQHELPAPPWPMTLARWLRAHPGVLVTGEPYGPRVWELPAALRN